MTKEQLDQIDNICDSKSCSVCPFTYESDKIYNCYIINLFENPYLTDEQRQIIEAKVIEILKKETIGENRI